MLGGRVTVFLLYSMLCVLLFFNFGFGQTIYTGVSSGPGQYAYHRMIVSSKLLTNDALQCVQRKNPYVLKSELMTTRYVKNKDDDVAKRAALLFCFQKEGVLKLSRASPS